MREVADWLLNWTVAAGIEGVVSKRLVGRYEPGRRGWWKFRTRLVTEAIVGGVTGSLRIPVTVLLGRFDRRGRLRYTGCTPSGTWPPCRDRRARGPAGGPDLGTTAVRAVGRRCR